MDGNLEKECSALGGLFQSVINDLKNGYPVWDDFAQKATKMSSQLKGAITAINVFLDALQRVADLATNAKGATRDIGTALTRICMRHRSIENRLKTLTSALIDCLVSPLQEKLDDWRRTTGQLDKEHAREYKRARAEIKKRALDSGRLQKKVRKGQNSMQRMLDSAVHEVNDRYYVLLETERQAVRQALTEQRSQFCIFVSWFKPVMDGELSLLNEIAQLQEVVDLLYKHSADPFTLPPASEAVITDIKGLENTWRYQTPPSSPGSSLGSRKSSYCSLSSAESSSQQVPHQPTLPVQLQQQHHQQRIIQNVIPASPRFSSMSSQDSGFTSQDAIYHTLRRAASPKPAQTSKQGPTASDDGGSTPESYDSQQSTPSPSPSSATWPAADGGGGGGAPSGAAAIMQRIVQMTPPLQRPHTISAAFSGQVAKRPIINPATFVPPRPTNLFRSSPKSKRSSSQDPGAQRPPLPQQPQSQQQLKSTGGGGGGRATPSSHSVASTPVIPDFNLIAPNQIIPQPIYANLQDLQQQSSSSSSSSTLNNHESIDHMVMTRHMNNTGTIRQRPRQRPLSFASADDTSSLLSMALDGCQGQSTMTTPTIRDDDEETLIDECVDKIDQMSFELGKYSSLRNRCYASDMDISPKSLLSDGIGERANRTTGGSGAGGGLLDTSYCTLPRRIHQPHLHSLRAALKGGLITPLATSNPFGAINRRQSGRAPPPPARRNSTITAATPTAPAVDIVRSRCTSPDDGNYAAFQFPINNQSSIASVESMGPPPSQPYTSVNHQQQRPSSIIVFDQSNYQQQQQQSQQQYQETYSQPRTIGFRANSEPPIQENAVYYPQQQQRRAFTQPSRDNLLLEIRAGIRLRSTNNAASATTTAGMADVQRM